MNPVRSSAKKEIIQPLPSEAALLSSGATKKRAVKTSYGMKKSIIYKKFSFETRTVSVRVLFCTG